MPRNIKARAVPLIGGMNSRYNAETVVAEALLSQQNMDTFEEFRALGKVPGSTAVAANSGYGAVRSLHQFEWTDLDGVRKRHQLELAAFGVLQRIESGGALTLLRAGLTGEALCDAVMQERLFLSSPNQRALPTGGLRYDGTNVRNWGVVAPGQEQVVRHALDDHTLWTGSADVTKSNSTVSRDGGGSVRVDKTGVASTEAYIEDAGLALDLTGAGAGTAFIYLFIPNGGLQALSGAATSVELRIGNAGLTNANRYRFGTGSLVPGWNLLSFVLAAPDAIDGTGAALGAVDTVRLRLETPSAVTTFTGFLWDRLYTTTDGQLEATLGAVGTPTGTLSYRVTFLTETGVESNGGVASVPLSVALRNVELNGIPVSGDPQVIARRIYRDLNGDSIYRFVMQLDDNLTTTATDTLAAASLGEATMPIAGDDEIDNSPPTRFSDCVAFGNRIFGIDADNRSIVWVSEINGPETFRLIDQFTVTDELAALTPQGLGLLLIGRDQAYVLLGDGVSTPFSAEEWNPQLGANSFRCATRAKGMTFTMREAEAYLVADPRDPWYFSGPIQDQLDAIADPTGVFLLHDRSRYRMLVFDGVSGVVRSWQYGTLAAGRVQGDNTAGIDHQDLRIAAWSSLSLPASAVPLCAALVERDAESPECWVGCSDGRVYRLQDPAATSWATDFGTEPIVAEFESHALPIGEGDGFIGRGEPRYLILDATSPVASTWECTISLLTHAQGKVLKTRTFNVALPAGDSSPRISVPPIGVRAGAARVKLRNAIAGQLAVFRSVSLVYVPRGAFTGSRAA